MTPHRLLTIPISHYCEKARWALDRVGAGYREERHVQAIHVAYALRAGRGPTVPVLICASGDVLTQSAAILRWTDGRADPGARLYPAGPAGEQAAELEAWLDDGLGVDARLWMYAETLPVKARLAPFILDGTPAWERRAFRAGGPVLDQIVRRHFGVTPTSAAEALERVERVFDAVAARLEDGRPYLCGEHFTAADLAFAALSAPVLVPARYGSPLPALDALPPAMALDVKRLRDHPAGRFADRLYGERPAGAANA